MVKLYDLIIIGAGPAGLAASLYASRYKLDHLVLGMELGGQLKEIHSLENWPGAIAISGQEFLGQLLDQAGHFGIKPRQESVAEVKKNEAGDWEVVTSRETYQARSIIFAMGAKYRRINVPGEKDFIGRGVSYCATCDAPFFRGKKVCVLGGGNSAAVVALELADYASRVYLIYRDKLSAEPIWLEKIESNEKIEKISQTQVIEIKGQEKVERVILDRAYQDKTFLEIEGVFVEVGSDPGVELAKKLGVETDDSDFIKVNSDQGTNVLGIFAAGDITTGSNKFRQVLTACAEGSIAASSVYKLLKLKD